MLWLIIYQNGSTRTVRAASYTQAYLNAMCDLIITDIKQI